MNNTRMKNKLKIMNSGCNNDGNIGIITAVIEASRTTAVAATPQAAATISTVIAGRKITASFSLARGKTVSWKAIHAPPFLPPSPSPPPTEWPSNAAVILAGWRKSARKRGGGEGRGGGGGGVLIKRAVPAVAAAPVVKSQNHRVSNHVACYGGVITRNV